MRLATRLLLATSIAAVALPAAARDSGTDCGREVTSFLEALRADDGFPLIAAAFPDLEQVLVGAVESREGICLAVLADIRTRLFDAGYVVAGVTDPGAVDRGRDLALRSASPPFEMGRNAGPNAAARQGEAEVTVSQAGTADETIVGAGREVDAAGDGGDATGDARAEEAAGGLETRPVGATEPAPPGGTLADEIARSRREFGRAAAGTGGGDIARDVEAVATIAIFARA